MGDSHKLDADFDWLANVYNAQGAINHPSELHGLIVGELAGGMIRSSDDWLQMVQDHMAIESLDLSRQTNLEQDLLAYYSDTCEGIDKDSSELVLLLPDDDYPLTERVEALAFWVRGFLEGLAISATTQLSGLADEAQEILRDLVEISQLDHRVPNGEDGEREFFEICEYVRVGVLNLYADLNEPQVTESDSGTSPTIH